MGHGTGAVVHEEVAQQTLADVGTPGRANDEVRVRVAHAPTDMATHPNWQKECHRRGGGGSHRHARVAAWRLQQSSLARQVCRSGRQVQHNTVQLLLRFDCPVPGSPTPCTTRPGCGPADVVGDDTAGGFARPDPFPPPPPAPRLQQKSRAPRSTRLPTSRAVFHWTIHESTRQMPRSTAAAPPTSAEYWGRGRCAGASLPCCRTAGTWGD